MISSAFSSVSTSSTCSTFCIIAAVDCSLRDREKNLIFPPIALSAYGDVWIGPQTKKPVCTLEALELIDVIFFALCSNITFITNDACLSLNAFQCTSIALYLRRMNNSSILDVRDSVRNFLYLHGFAVLRALRYTLVEQRSAQPTSTLDGAPSRNLK